MRVSFLNKKTDNPEYAKKKYFEKPTSPSESHCVRQHVMKQFNFNNFREEDRQNDTVAQFSSRKVSNGALSKIIQRHT